MEISTTWFKDKYNILIYGVLITCSVLAALLAVTNIKISPDSMRFGLVSQQILSGNGIRVPIIRLEDNFVPVDGAVPFLDQMPLLPILFALMGSVTFQNYLPAQLLNLVCHVAMTIFTFLLMRKLCHKGIALLTGILVSFSYPLLLNINHIWSEPLFIALIMATIYFLALSRNSDRYHFSLNLFIAGICASAAIFTRNAGIALIPVFLWEAFILIKNKRAESKYISTILAIALPIITSAAMFVRNYIISGTLRGFNQPSIERSYLDAVAGTINMIFQQFQLGERAIALIIICIILFIFSIMSSTNLRRESIKFFNEWWNLIIIFICSYTVLIGITMAKQQWRFDLRYVSPLVPFVFITGIVIIVFVVKRATSGRFSRLSLIGVILPLIILTTGNFYKTYLNLPEFLYSQRKVYSLQSSCTYQWIKENYRGNIIIATNRPFHLSFFGGYSTIALPHKRFDSTIKVPEDMEAVLPRQMSKFKSQVLALFEESDERYEGSYISNLFNNRADNDTFLLVHTCSDGVVYAMKE